MMKAWKEIFGITLSDVHIPPLPWVLGSPPLVLLFELDTGVHPKSSRWVTITLGSCITVPDSATTGPRSKIEECIANSHESSSHRHTVERRYVIIQRYPEDRRPDIQSLVPYHSCEHDHLDPIRISEPEKWTEWPIQRKIEDGLSIQFRPGILPLDSATPSPVTTLEVKIIGDDGLGEPLWCETHVDH